MNYLLQINMHVFTRPFCLERSEDLRIRVSHGSRYKGYKTTKLGDQRSERWEHGWLGFEFGVKVGNMTRDNGAVEQISYASRYTRSRTQRFFCTTSEVGDYGCARVEKQTTKENGRETPSNPAFLLTRWHRGRREHTRVNLSKTKLRTENVWWKKSFCRK